MLPLTPPALALPLPAATEATPLVKPAQDSPEQAAAKQAARQYESHFIGQMLHEMRRSARALGDEPEAQRAGEDLLDMADTLVADQLASQGAFGIADLLLRQVMPSAVDTPASAPAPRPV